MSAFDSSKRTFVCGEGTMLTDALGHELFDATSSIWTIVHGHGRPEIVAAIARQAATLDHSTLLGATHPRAEELAERLCALASMDYAFFSSDGASAIEVAAKMALRYWAVNGQPQRTRFVRLDHAYHGDTAAAMSLSDITIFKEQYGALTFEAFPFDASATILMQDDIAAVIVEPLVQAAAGILTVPTMMYAPMRDMQPLLIVDEIATGFGRTGTFFASEQLALQPDLMCVGKGLTGGVLALSATLTTQRIYDAFLAEHAAMRQFFHGHSFAGNPIACAAALASIELFDRNSTLAAAARIHDRIVVHLRKLVGHSAIRATRLVGTMTGIELRSESLDAGTAKSGAWRIADLMYERGHFTRPIGDVVQLVPPLTTSDAEIDAFFDVFSDALEQACI